MGIVVVGLLGLTAISLVQPALRDRALWSMLVLVLGGGVTEFMGRMGHPRAASWLLILGPLAIITANALPAGGITSPGIRSVLVFVLIGGVLLGERAAIGVAALCSVLGLGLALLERSGALPPHSIVYDPLAQWILLSLYLGVTVVLMRVFARSVYESHRLEDEAARGEAAANQRLDAVLKASGIGIWSFEVERDAYLGDERVHAILGSTADPQAPVPAEVWRALVVPEDLPALMAMFGRLTAQGGSETQSLQIVTPAGQVRHLDITCIAAVGNPVITGLVHDRTVEREAEAARIQATADLTERVKELTVLHAASRLLRPGRAIDASLLTELIDLIPRGFVRPDRTVALVRCGDLTAASPQWTDTRWQLAQQLTCGTPAGEIRVGYTDVEGSAADPFLEEERELLASLAEMFEAFVARDHAEQLRNSFEEQMRQSQKMEALGTLAGGIAHDFNNILTAIGGNIALAKLHATPADPLLDPLDQIERATARASNLVRRILLFSRRQESSMRATQLGPIVEEVAKLLQASTPAHIEIRVEQADALPTLLADENQLHQVLVNLGTNAVYAMGERTGTLTFSVDTIEEQRTPSEESPGLPPGRYLRLVVRDTGVGIEPSIRARLFDPFFTTKGGAGTGLGLAVVHGVVQSHQGRIEVESTVGEGTTFTLYFPATGATTPTSEATAQSIARGHGERVLYVDDEEPIVFVMGKMLRSVGYECDGFTNPHEALQAFRNTPHEYDAVVTDHSMPGMTGRELTQALDAIRPGIPVIMSSGFATAELAANEVPTNRCVLPKPVSIVELSQALRMLLRPDEVTDGAGRPGPARP